MLAVYKSGQGALEAVLGGRIFKGLPASAICGSLTALSRAADKRAIRTTCYLRNSVVGVRNGILGKILITTRPEIQQKETRDERCCSAGNYRIMTLQCYYITVSVS